MTLKLNWSKYVSDIFFYLLFKQCSIIFNIVWIMHYDYKNCLWHRYTQYFKIQNTYTLHIIICKSTQRRIMIYVIKK